MFGARKTVLDAYKRDTFSFENIDVHIDYLAKTLTPTTESIEEDAIHHGQEE